MTPSQTWSGCGAPPWASEKIIRRLIAANGEYVTWRDLAEYVYDERIESHHDIRYTSLRVLINRLRKRDYKIESHRGFGRGVGYRLIAELQTGAA